MWCKSMELKIEDIPTRKCSLYYLEYLMEHEVGVVTIFSESATNSVTTVT